MGFKSAFKVLRTCRTVCVSNIQKTLSVELHFELDDFCTSGFVFCKQIAVLWVLFA